MAGYNYIDMQPSIAEHALKLRVQQAVDRLPPGDTHSWQSIWYDLNAAHTAIYLLVDYLGPKSAFRQAVLDNGGEYSPDSGYRLPVSEPTSPDEYSLQEADWYGLHEDVWRKATNALLSTTLKDSELRVSKLTQTHAVVWDSIGALVIDFITSREPGWVGAEAVRASVRMMISNHPAFQDSDNNAKIAASPLL